MIFWDLSFSLLCVLRVYIFYFILNFFDLTRWNTFLLVLKSKSMFSEHYFLPQVKNIGNIKICFHLFLFQNCFVFHLITFLKVFLVLSDLLKQRKFLTNLKNSRIISAYHIEVFAKKNNHERKINCTWS